MLGQHVSERRSALGIGIKGQPQPHACLRSKIGNPMATLGWKGFTPCT